MAYDLTEEVLTDDFFARPAAVVARDLLGAVLVSTVEDVLVAGRIVETEAYTGPEDPASHAAERIGRTNRNAAMFGPPGTAYVYRIYGLHWCLNVVTDREGFPAAVLIRALEPLAGLEIMSNRRGIESPVAIPREYTLAAGPGRLAQALGVAGALDAHPLRHPPHRLHSGPAVPQHEIAIGPRIGVTRATDRPLRFYLRHSPCVSR
jgi:DNA-3-methyladenine glycosylase